VHADGRRAVVSSRLLSAEVTPGQHEVPAREASLATTIVAVEADVVRILAVRRARR
jgi:hypothetical protein